MKKTLEINAGEADTITQDGNSDFSAMESFSPYGADLRGGKRAKVTIVIDNGTNTRKIVVDMADMKASNDPTGLLSTYMLGACLAVAIYDPEVRVGGLLHFILPESALNMQKAMQNPYFFADTGIPLLFRSTYKLGAQKERIICRLVGASRFLDPDNIFNMAERNHLAASAILSKNNVTIAKEYVGGLAAMTVTMHLSTGRTTVHMPSGEEIEL